MWWCNVLSEGWRRRDAMKKSEGETEQGWGEEKDGRVEEGRLTADVVGGMEEKIGLLSDKSLDSQCVYALFPFRRTTLLVAGLTKVQKLNITTCCVRRGALRRRGPRSHTLPPPLFLHPPSPAHVPAPALRLAAHPSLPRPRRTSFGGDDVAAVGVPLHVADAPNRLHLRAAGPELIEVLEFALFQQVLVATVARELVSHKSARGGGRDKKTSEQQNKKR